jgi:hypothetical protein
MTNPDLRVLAIDPGTTLSAYIDYIPALPPSGCKFGKISNDELLYTVLEPAARAGADIAIENVASYGMAVGREVFETVLWIGRFYQAAVAAGSTPHLIYRREVKVHLCGNMKANDANIRQALLDRFGGKGTKKNPGPTYGLKADVWSALAIAVTWHDTRPF